MKQTTSTSDQLRCVVLGAGGMLATAVEQHVKSLASSAEQWHFLTENDLDITHADHVERTLRMLQPHWIINLAAYTNVDGAEINREVAFTINRDGPHTLSHYCNLNDCSLMHLSTDYVFGDHDQVEGHEPRIQWSEEDAPKPLNIYGESKRAGEQAVLESGCDALIIRSAWLFASHGQNFVRTITEKLLAGETLHVVNDQIGSPTSCSSLAATIVQLVESPVRGVIHTCNSGSNSSWYDIACVIRDSLDLPDHRVQPCASTAFPRPARRPRNSALSTAKVATVLPNALCLQVNWREEVREVTTQIAAQLDSAIVETIASPVASTHKH